MPRFFFKAGKKSICKVWQVPTWVKLARKENCGFNKLEESRTRRFIRIDWQHTRWCIVLLYNQCVDKWKVIIFREKPYSWLWKQEEKVSTILSQYMNVVLFHNGRLTNCTYQGNRVYRKDNSFYVKWIQVLLGKVIIFSNFSLKETISCKAEIIVITTQECWEDKMREYVLNIWFIINT